MALEFIELLGALPTPALMAVGLLRTPPQCMQVVEHLRLKLRHCKTAQRHPSFTVRQMNLNYSQQVGNRRHTGGRRSDDASMLAKIVEEDLLHLNYRKLKPNEIRPLTKVTVHLQHPSRLIVWAQKVEAGNRALHKLLR